MSYFRLSSAYLCDDIECKVINDKSGACPICLGTTHPVQPMLENHEESDMIRNLFKKIAPADVKMVAAFIAREPGSYDAMLKYFNERVQPLTRVGGRDYNGILSGVRVCNDICGPEVKLGWNPGAELLDCCPAYYGLTHDQALELYEAILSCVPGTTLYAEKQERQGRMISSVAVTYNV